MVAQKLRLDELKPVLGGVYAREIVRQEENDRHARLCEWSVVAAGPLFEGPARFDLYAEAEGIWERVEEGWSFILTSASEQKWLFGFSDS